MRWYEEEDTRLQERFEIDVGVKAESVLDAIIGMRNDKKFVEGIAKLLGELARLGWCGDFDEFDKLMDMMGLDEDDLLCYHGSKESLAKYEQRYYRDVEDAKIAHCDI